jgi:transposase
MNEISMIGLDLAKNVFQVHGVDVLGKVVLQKQLRRGAVEKFFAKGFALHGGNGGVW